MKVVTTMKGCSANLNIVPSPEADSLVRVLEISGTGTASFSSLSSPLTELGENLGKLSEALKGIELSSSLHKIQVELKKLNENG